MNVRVTYRTTSFLFLLNPTFSHYNKSQTNLLKVLLVSMHHPSTVLNITTKSVSTIVIIHEHKQTVRIQLFNFMHNLMGIISYITVSTII